MDATCFWLAPEGLPGPPPLRADKPPTVLLFNSFIVEALENLFRPGVVGDKERAVVMD